MPTTPERVFKAFHAFDDALRSAAKSVSEKMAGITAAVREPSDD
jgi:hypothetical protein